MTDFRTYEFTRTQNFKFHGMVLITAVTLSLLFYRNVFFSVVILPFIPKIRVFAIEYCRKKRSREYLIQFKDFLFIAATSIGAGRSMKDAIAEAIPRLQSIHEENEVLVPELKRAFERMEFANEDDVGVLTDLATLSGQEDVIDFVTIFAICRVTGASLIRGMNQAAMVIIDKMTIEREIEERIRRKEQEGIIILMAPILVIVFLNVTSPEYIAPLYETFRGRFIMTVTIASNIGIYEWIQRIVKVKI